MGQKWPGPVPLIRLGSDPSAGEFVCLSLRVGGPSPDDLLQLQSVLFLAAGQLLPLSAWVSRLQAVLWAGTLSGSQQLPSTAPIWENAVHLFLIC